MLYYGVFVVSGSKNDYQMSNAVNSSPEEREHILTKDEDKKWLMLKNTLPILYCYNLDKDMSKVASNTIYFSCSSQTLSSHGLVAGKWQHYDLLETTAILKAKRALCEI